MSDGVEHLKLESDTRQEGFASLQHAWHPLILHTFQLRNVRWVIVYCARSKWALNAGSLSCCQSPAACVSWISFCKHANCMHVGDWPHRRGESAGMPEGR